jgi:hypothetical protein
MKARTQQDEEKISKKWSRYREAFALINLDTIRSIGIRIIAHWKMDGGIRKGG